MIYIYTHDSYTCPWCDAAGHTQDFYLGSLGSTSHFRCRYCGQEWCEPGVEVLASDDEEACHGDAHSHA